ncbi:hypothetical protein [Xanthomonas vasicola]|uniref:Uncharacterized protein n=1 Tax=Xanthomonas vasicola pv. vasculorum NCPPB 890 TaxID=1184265 RepID=A0A836P2M0_XANVA|nr:hypothetical protein [Xanthomonas vasicola]KFA31961.1 hypothetical protein KWS_0114280 [Xanthomonas vasicola pv. musacearum NCPPB 4384]AZR29837.1 hypothetical protein KWO_004055 [Xanthomonas vasicola pv. musacearum NCPPB 4379]KFA11389.1 hypothetical protein KWQ_0109400 [Xanthomonas vasicola pv. musacearum NCPPB 4380]KFA12121.1 hypothetical protein KWM_0104635 [Xanthomonas vasicola pv. musacearum NCPPB 2005]KFA21463.1 hypothetical protein A11G_0101905 [Xanthomonas vasicola pv. musacearum NCP
MTEALELMLNGVSLVAMPTEPANLGDAARQRFSNASYAGSHRCSAIAAGTNTTMCCRMSFRSNNTRDSVRW